ncbi:hypothetical protein [Lysobacter soli]|uniref:hypothetical protein n=1 Tax=Lysobacter soli TaxID=453783 RepID=UPI0018DB08D9|nr:hypothetical protein [Lysobacter soli]
MTQIDRFAHHRAAIAAGAMMLANEGRHGRPLTYHVVNAEGREPAFTCEPHEYLAVTPWTPQTEPFQMGVSAWMAATFPKEVCADIRERGDRLLEEVLELLQAHGYDRDRVATLTQYVYGRHVGEPAQEVGGVMVTLGAYCLAAGLDMHACGDAELARVWTKIDEIRAKQGGKRGLHTPLPTAPDSATADTLPITVWQINDMEWFAGAGTPESILAWYMEEHGLSHEDATGDEDELPRALSDHELDTLKFQDCDENERPTGIVRTFREQLAIEVAEGGTFPRLFASTEC